MPKTILTAAIFILLLTLIFFTVFSKQTLPISIHSFFNLSLQQKQFTNFSIELETKEFLLKSEIDKIVLNSTDHYSIIIGDLILEARKEENIIFNFSGSIYKKEDRFSIIGKFSKANINEVNITGKDKEIKILNETFDLILFNNFKAGQFKLENVYGVLKIPNIEMNLENATIEIFSIFSNLTYNKTIKIEGISKEIKVNNKLLIASS